ncbi:MAG: hypothetical protein P1P77_16610 [Spirochaetaceae bacterium]|nr:hypothetical protein [Spirochaetaceae bacterium]
MLFSFVGCSDSNDRTGQGADEIDETVNREIKDLPVFDIENLLSEDDWDLFFSNIESQGISKNDEIFMTPTLAPLIDNSAKKNGFTSIGGTSVTGPAPRKVTVGSIDILASENENKVAILYLSYLGRIDNLNPVWQLSDYLYVEVDAKNPATYSIVGSNDLGIFDLDDPAFVPGAAVSVEKIISVSVDTSELLIRDNVDGSFKAYNEIP